MASAWYYKQGGTKKGPVSTADLRQMALNGSLRPTDLLWKEGMKQWKPAGEARGLFPVAAEQGTAKETSDSGQQKRSNSTHVAKESSASLVQTTTALRDRIEGLADSANRAAERTKIITISLPLAYVTLGRWCYENRYGVEDNKEIFSAIEQLGAGNSQAESSQESVDPPKGFTAIVKAASASGLRTVRQHAARQRQNVWLHGLGERIAASGGKGLPPELIEPIQHLKQKLLRLDEASTSPPMPRKKGSARRWSLRLAVGVAFLVLIGAVFQRMPTQRGVGDSDTAASLSASLAVTGGLPDAFATGVSNTIVLPGMQAAATNLYREGTFASYEVIFSPQGTLVASCGIPRAKASMNFHWHKNAFEKITLAPLELMLLWDKQNDKQIRSDRPDGLFPLPAAIGPRDKTLAYLDGGMLVIGNIGDGRIETIDRLRLPSPGADHGEPRDQEWHALSWQTDDAIVLTCFGVLPKLRWHCLATQERGAWTVQKNILGKPRGSIVSEREPWAISPDGSMIAEIGSSVDREGPQPGANWRLTLKRVASNEVVASVPAGPCTELSLGVWDASDCCRMPKVGMAFTSDGKHIVLSEASDGRGKDAVLRILSTNELKQVNKVPMGGVTVESQDDRGRGRIRWRRQGMRGNQYVLQGLSGSKAGEYAYCELDLLTGTLSTLPLASGDGKIGPADSVAMCSENSTNVAFIKAAGWDVERREAAEEIYCSGIADRQATLAWECKLALSANGIATDGDTLGIANSGLLFFSLEDIADTAALINEAESAWAKGDYRAMLGHYERVLLRPTTNLMVRSLPTLWARVADGYASNGDPKKARQVMEWMDSQGWAVLPSTDAGRTVLTQINNERNAAIEKAEAERRLEIARTVPGGEQLIAGRSVEYQRGWVNGVQLAQGHVRSIRQVSDIMLEGNIALASKVDSLIAQFQQTSLSLDIQRANAGELDEDSGYLGFYEGFKVVAKDYVW